MQSKKIITSTVTKKIVRHLTKKTLIEVFYAAFLATLIYEPSSTIIEYFYKLEWKKDDFLNGETTIVFLKLILLIVCIWFFCCHFLYNVLLEEYHSSYEGVIDIGVLISLAFIFKAIETKSTDVPSFKTINLFFVVIMVLHLIWSKIQLSHYRKKKDDIQLEDYYKLIFWIEIALAALFGIGIFLPDSNPSNPNSNQFGQWYSIALIVASDIVYVWALFHRKDRYPEEIVPENKENFIVLKPVSSPPSKPEMGTLYFDSKLEKMKCYDGKSWRECW